MFMKEKELQLLDGRQIGFAEYGDEDGYPIVYVHGTPSSRVHPLTSAMDDIVKRQGLKIRVLSFERPGYGLSSEAEDYSLDKWVKDIEELTKQLKLERFSVLGVSGGGPYALAISALLPLKVDKTAIIAGLGPVYLPELFEVLPKYEKESALAAIHAPEKIEEYIAQVREDSKGFVEHLLYQLPVEDRAKIPQSMADVYVLTLTEASKNAFGMINDYRIFQQPWPFSLDDINVPIAFFHSDADEMVPLAHSEYLAKRINQAALNKLEGFSHFSVMFAALPGVLKFILS